MAAIIILDTVEEVAGGVAIPVLLINTIDQCNHENHAREIRFTATCHMCWSTVGQYAVIRWLHCSTKHYGVVGGTGGRDGDEGKQVALPRQKVSLNVGATESWCL